MGQELAGPSPQHLRQGIVDGIGLTEPHDIAILIPWRIALSGEVLAGLDTRLDTPPFSAYRHPVSRIARTPATTDTSTDTPSTLSINPKMSDFAINAALGLAGGPIGGLIAGVNGVSGLLGGSTFGGGLNSLLAGGGGNATSLVGGQGGNGKSGTYAQPASSGSDPTSSDGSTGSTSSGGTTGTETGTTTTTPPLTTHRIHHTYDVSNPTSGVYDPMQDPAVLQALAAMRT